MKLLVIDGNSIINRAFYGIRLLTNKAGVPTNAVLGFLRIYKKLCDLCTPDAAAAAFDLSEPTFRHKQYDAYKAGRRKMPDELAEQLPILKELLQDLGIRVLETPGFEADDILGTLSAACEKSGNDCFLATGDRDALQLVNDHTTVLLASNKETKVYTPQTLFDEYGVTPKEMIEIKALQGDASDNIPGVAGIGQKTALSLIQNYHSIDYIFSHLDTLDVKPGVRTKLQGGEESARMSKHIGTIVTDAPVDTNIETYRLGGGDKKAAAAKFRELELYSLIDTFDLGGEAPPAEETPETPVKTIQFTECTDTNGLLNKLQNAGKAWFLPIKANGSVCGFYFVTDESVTRLQSGAAGFDAFCRAFSESGIEKYTYDLKATQHLAIALGCEVQNVRADLMLSAYVLRPTDGGSTLPRLAGEYGVPAPKCENAPEDAGDALEDALLLKPLIEKTQAALDDKEQALLQDVELPLVRVLAEMESEGFAADRAGIEAFSQMLSTRIDELTEEIYAYIGETFNINSPKQLGVALFEKLGLPCPKKTKSGYSTNAEVLEKLQDTHPVISLILEYRKLTKLKSTYCDGLLKVIDNTGRIHTSFNQAETRTGRISSLEPNLQNIPIRTELGREMRKFFTAKDGCVLVDADYSQIELRVLAALADDKAMIDAFNSGADIHTTTASQVFGLPENMVTPQMRSRAKAVNFGIVYGIGAFSLAGDIHVSVKEAKQYIDGYLNHYKGVDAYMKKSIETAKEKGYSETLFGRKRYLPELNSKNHMMRAFGERVARNMPIQGTAADIIKIAMIRVRDRMKAEGYKARLILQVHDELIVEAPKAEAEAVRTLVQEEMESACALSVKLVADAKIGKTWYDAH